MLGEGSHCTARSKLNKFEHVFGGRGVSLFAEVQ